jgi:hypothetical protein
MSKLQLVVFTFCFTAFPLAAQSTHYQFSYHEEPYFSLVNPELLTLQGYLPSPAMFYETIPIGFPFTIDDISVDSANVLISSPSIVWATPINCTSGLSHGLTSIFAFSCRKRSDTLSTTEIRYLTEGVLPSRIFKLEYFNLGFKDFPGHIDLQIWLYEGSDSIQIRIGQLELPNIPTLFITGLNGPLIGLQTAYHGVFDSDAADYTQMVNGTPNNPGSAEIFCPSSPVGFGIWYQSMSGVPKNGAVFTFYPEKTNLVEEMVQSSDWVLSPNPAKDYVEVKNWPLLVDEQKVDIFNSFGKRLKSITISKEDSMIDCNDLPNGNYYLEARINGSVKVGKFIVLK